MIRSKIRTRDRMSRSFAVIKPMGGGQIAGTRQNKSIGSNEYADVRGLLLNKRKMR